MFTQACFIKKNTYKIRKKLNNLGYHKFKYCRDKFENDDVLAVIETDDDIPVYTYISYINIVNMDFVNCETDENLFIAIAALNNNTDKYQWFTDGYQWTKCNTDKFNKENFHKANKEELIKHFNMY